MRQPALQSVPRYRYNGGMKKTKTVIQGGTRSPMNANHNRRSAGWGLCRDPVSRQKLVIPVLAVVLFAAVAGSRAAEERRHAPPRRFLSPSMPEILALWRDPPRVCSQAPFWFWNGPLDPNTMREQVRMMADKGVHAAMPHPRFGMDRRLYLEEPFWKAMDATMDEAAKIGSAVWLYDEYNWPSGGAGGRVTDGHPEFYPRGLDYAFVECEGPRDFTVSRPEPSEKVMVRFERIIAAFIGPAGDSIPREPWGQMDSSGESITGPVPNGRRRILVFFRCLGRNPSPLDDGSNSFIDYLRPEPTRRFIELTYEPYARRYGHLFSKQIPAIFYDEPSTMAPAPFPWTFGFEQVFQERRGFDLVANLPALLDDSFPEAGLIRAAYWQAVSERFNECFFDQLERWCRAHGLPLTGHCYEENITHYANVPHLMEHLRRVDWPGFDALGTRARPAAAKIPISVTHLEDREEVICESMGLAGGWNCTLDMLRGGYNQLACLGATTFIPHAFFQTVENPRVECPPSFFYQNSYWKYYGRLSGLTDRLSLFNRLGRHVAPVLVYYPIESLWMDSTGVNGQKTFPWQHTTLGNDGAKATIDGFNVLVDGLFNNLWDLDIIDGKALESARIVQTDAGSRIATGPEQYRVLVFPPTRAIAPSALRVAADFARAGGTVLWTGRLPETCWPVVPNQPERTLRELAIDRATAQDRVGKAGAGTVAFFARPQDAVKGLSRVVEPEVAVKSGDSKGLLINHRRTESGDLYLCFNDSDRTLDCQLVLPHSQTATPTWLRLDTETGETTSLQQAATTPESSVRLVLSAHASVVLFCSSSVSGQAKWQPEPALQEELEIKGPWMIQVLGNALDDVWAPTARETVVELPAFRHRAREYQRHPGWEARDYDDAGWEQVYAVRDSALFVHASPVLLRGVLPPGAKAIETPLPVTGAYVLYVNGVELDKRLGPPPQPGRIDISKAVTGMGDVVAIETTSHRGPAGLEEPLRVICGPVSLSGLQPWRKWNLSWYSGRVLYRTELDIVPAAQEQRWFLDLGGVQHYAEVWLNGRLVETLLWPPYRLEVTRHLKKGENELVLVVSNSIANRFAWDIWGTRGSGKPEPSGLLGPVRLLTAKD